MNTPNNSMNDTNLFHTSAAAGGISSGTSFLASLVMTGEASLGMFFQNLIIALIVGLVGMFLTWILKPVFDAYYHPVLDFIGIKYKRDKKSGE